MEKLKNMKLRKKLYTGYGILITFLVFSQLIAVIGVMSININLKKFYEGPYVDTTLIMELRKDLQVSSRYVLWAATTTDVSLQKERLNLAKQYEDEMVEKFKKLENSFKDDKSYSDMQKYLNQIVQNREDIVLLLDGSDEGDEKALEIYNNEYITANDEIVQYLMSMNDDSDNKANNQYSIITTVAMIIAVAGVIIAIMAILVSITIAKATTRIIIEPIYELENAANLLKSGKLREVSFVYQSQDELGQLTQNFSEACNIMKDIILESGNVLSEMSNGNFNLSINNEEKFVGEFQIIKDTIMQLILKLNDTLLKIDDASEQVFLSSQQMSESAQNLAEGATEQASAIEELTATIENVTSISFNNVESAKGVSNYAKELQENARYGQEVLKDLSQAIQKINESSKQIENIIVDIEEIATQTNLLSLNASIEAARAGEAGKGFAVVAGQIGKLATDSANSAINSRELIQKSIEEIQIGNKKNEETTKILMMIMNKMHEMVDICDDTSRSSEEQANMLHQIEEGIEQISGIVQSNSAVAEESSASSEELASQSEVLKNQVAYFKLKN